MLKDIVLIAHFTDDLDSENNGRFNYLADLLAEMGVSIEIVTSSFSHNKKKQREMRIPSNLNYKITFIEEPAYAKNISLKRFYSHYRMAINLKSYLNKRKVPDIIYCSVPSLDIAETAAKYAVKKQIKFIIDIQDLWPEAFKMAFGFPIISNMIFYPMKKRANYIYKSADSIIAVSETYLERALQVNQKYQTAKSVYLGTDLSTFDKFAALSVCKPQNEIWVAYIGTIGNSYDLKTVIDALHILKKRSIENIKFLIIGDGPLKNKFEKYAENQNISFEFTGRLEYRQMVRLLNSCDIAVNPIKTGSAGSIINKVGDYAAAGIPVINTQDCIEYRDLIDLYRAGLNCKNGDAVDVADKILYLIENPSEREKMGKNSRILAEEKFDRSKTYKDILDVLL